MLRGINVGGRAPVAMADLRRVFVDLGYDDVGTYIQSGNVLFRTTAPAAGLPGAIGRRLDDELGRPVDIVVRTAAQLATVLARNPFAEGSRDAARLHVTFLAGTPSRSQLAALDPDGYQPDEFRAVGREVYVHCPGGYGRTKLNNGFFERALGVAATTRSLRTVTELVRLSS